MDLQKRFDKSAKMVKQLKTKPSDNELLILYALYKQSEKDCNLPRPSGILELKEKAKWDAWNKLKGMSKKDAMTKYCEIVLNLIDKYGI
jgi:diazepam-binding inhibitor (GABA receptor modulating acyl-CoA-binding protein)